MGNSSLNYTAFMWDVVGNLNWMQDLYSEKILPGNTCICPCSLKRMGNSNACIQNYFICSAMLISKQKKMGAEHYETESKQKDACGFKKTPRTTKHTTTKNFFIFYGRIKIIFLVKLWPYARPLGHSVSKGKRLLVLLYSNFILKYAVKTSLPLFSSCRI